MGGYSAITDPTYRALSEDDDVNKDLAGLMSPAPAHSLVGPPPDTAPRHEIARSTPLTGNLAAAPSQAVAKNRDAGTGYDTGVSNPPDGGNVSNIVSPASMGGIRPAVRPGSAAPIMPGSVSGTSLQPSIPAGNPQQVVPDRLNMQTQQDQQKLSQLQAAKTGGRQINNRWGRIGAEILDTAGSIVAPGVAQYIPGASLNQQRLIGRQQGVVASDQGQQTQRAALEDTQSQAAERTALGQKASALAASDAPMTPTPEQASQVGHPEIAGLPLPPRTYSAMLVAKQRADSLEAVGKGHDTARVTVGQGNNETSAANNAATNATRVQTSKYGPGNRGVGGGGSGGDVPASQPGDLSGVPASMRGLVQAIGEGREGPAPLGRKDGKEIMRLVSQVYPDYDASQFHNYQATRNEFGKGITGRAINSFNTVLQHIGRMENNLPHNTGIPAANWVKNTLLKEVGSAANTPFEADRIAVATELGKVYKGGGVLTKDELDQYEKLLDRDASPAQQKSNLAELKGLLAGKLNAYQEQYKTGLPTGATRNFQVITPESQAILDRGQATPTSQAIPSGNIRVQLPNGQTGHISAGQKDQFLKDHPGAKVL